MLVNARTLLCSLFFIFCAAMTSQDSVRNRITKETKTSPDIESDGHRKSIKEVPVLRTQIGFYPHATTRPRIAYQKEKLDSCRIACNEVGNKTNCTKNRCLIQTMTDCKKIILPKSETHRRMMEKISKRLGRPVFMCSRENDYICTKKVFRQFGKLKLGDMEVFNSQCFLCKGMAEGHWRMQVNCPLLPQTATTAPKP